MRLYSIKNISSFSGQRNFIQLREKCFSKYMNQFQHFAISRVGLQRKFFLIIFLYPLPDLRVEIKLFLIEEALEALITAKSSQIC